jgi:hypothetical protein
MSKQLDLPKLSADIQRALSMPDGEEKNTLTHSVLVELSGLVDAMAKIANTIGDPVDESSYKIDTPGSGRRRHN